MTSAIVLLFSLFSFSKEMSPDSADKLKSYQPIQNCYKIYSTGKKKSALNKEILTLKLKFDDLNNVLSAKEISEKSTLHQKTFNSCIIDSLKKLKFSDEVPDENKELTISFTFPLKKD